MATQIQSSDMFAYIELLMLVDTISNLTIPLIVAKFTIVSALKVDLYTTGLN